MNILAAILILGASGSAQRSMKTDASIERIVAQVAWGAVSDVFAKPTGIGSSRFGALAGLEASGVWLAIDGTERTGWRAWGEAAVRVGGYVADFRTDGSVGLAYRLRIRGYDIATSTAVSDGRVVKVIDAWWTETVQVTRRITRRVTCHVTITIRARETEAGTLLVGEARGYADTSDFQCGLVRRIAEREASTALRVQLSAVLLNIERRGRQFYAGGAEIADVLDGINLGIKIAGRIRR